MRLVTVRRLASGGAWDQPIVRQPSDHQPPIYPPRTALQRVVAAPVSSTSPSPISILSIRRTAPPIVRTYLCALNSLSACVDSFGLVPVSACFDFGHSANTHTITTATTSRTPHRTASRRVALFAFTPP